ncbi:hypothetical protein Nepgr_029276 [Nepenthes gracilis]|uniref:Uncharacterized protein n=1 Tax=Nepenthes gracilis TaxID=150966 RepID=A0AAD3Y349_NEPGR|nr:hypothetical protein Nepgr_029276 [Nepenthes gracilis]
MGGLELILVFYVLQKDPVTLVQELDHHTCNDSLLGKDLRNNPHRSSTANGKQAESCASVVPANCELRAYFIEMDCPQRIGGFCALCTETLPSNNDSSVPQLRRLNSD